MTIDFKGLPPNTVRECINSMIRDSRAITGAASLDDLAQLIVNVLTQAGLKELIEENETLHKELQRHGHSTPFNG